MRFEILSIARYYLKCKVQTISMSQELKSQYRPTVPVARVPKMCHTQEEGRSEGEEVKVSPPPKAHTSTLNSHCKDTKVC